LSPELLFADPSQVGDGCPGARAGARDEQSQQVLGQGSLRVGGTWASVVASKAGFRQRACKQLGSPVALYREVGGDEQAISTISKNRATHAR
jgi:hypothetical protein